MDTEELIDVRRELHRRPEPAWREFYTTARIVEELERRGVDELAVGRDAIAPEHRTGLPPETELEAWADRAREAGVDETILEELAGGHTGVVATVDCGPGPTVALRVDIDALPIEEADDPDHRPAAAGFRSEHEGTSHACGHDAHATIGLGVIDAVREGEFSGTLKLFFQPAEEVIGGGKPMAESGHLEGVDYLLAVHVGLDHPTGELVAGIDGFLSVCHLEATFAGESTHAGARPEAGKNAISALGTAIGNLHAIPRHSAGATRVNVGVVEGGTASNVVAEEARLECEVRGESTELMQYTRKHAVRILESAARMHDCAVTVDVGSEAPSAESDPELSAVVADVAAGVDGVDTVLERDALGGSEDATFLMRTVQEAGGLACYVGVGTDHPGGHHTPTFDVDEESIRHGVETLAGTIETLSDRRP